MCKQCTHSLIGVKAACERKTDMALLLWLRIHSSRGRSAARMLRVLLWVVDEPHPSMFSDRH